MVGERMRSVVFRLELTADRFAKRAIAAGPFGKLDGRQGHALSPCAPDSISTTAKGRWFRTGAESLSPSSFRFLLSRPRLIVLHGRAIWPAPQRVGNAWSV